MEQIFFKEVLDSLTDGVYFMNMEGKVTYWNKAAERLSGYSASEVLGKSCSEGLLRHIDEDGNLLCKTGCPLASTMRDGVVREANIFMHHKFGHRVPVFVRASPMRNETGKILGAVEIFTDNSKNLNMIEEMEKLKKEVLTDQLTEVGNRRYASIIMERLEVSLHREDVPFGVLFADIDFFKKVNDTWGHNVGDIVLKMVAKTLEASLRPLDVVCRWGGEEFVILIPNIEADGLAALSERIRKLVAQAWVDQGQDRIVVTASFGGAIAEKGEGAASVVERADKQLYLSKEAGRNCTYIDGVNLSLGS